MGVQNRMNKNKFLNLCKIPKTLISKTILNQETMNYEGIYKRYCEFMDDSIRKAFQHQILKLYEVGMYMAVLDLDGIKIVLESPYKEIADEIQNKLSEYEKAYEGRFNK